MSRNVCHRELLVVFLCLHTIYHSVELLMIELITFLSKTPVTILDLIYDFYVKFVQICCLYFQQ